MSSTANITMQFGAKPRSMIISVKFGDGNQQTDRRQRLRQVDADEKSSAAISSPTSGNVSVDANERLGKLRQDQFAFEDYTVLDTVIMGHAETCGA